MEKFCNCFAKHSQTSCDTTEAGLAALCTVLVDYSGTNHTTTTNMMNAKYEGVGDFLFLR